MNPKRSLCLCGEKIGVSDQLLKIEQIVLNQIIHHAESEFPFECCGLLTGIDTTISNFQPCRNTSRSEKSFQIHPKELFDFFRSIRVSELDFLGIYHSHPQATANPSKRDKNEFYYPGISYWIISLAGQTPKVKCYQWMEGEFVLLEYETLS